MDRALQHDANKKQEPSAIPVWAFFEVCPFWGSLQLGGLFFLEFFDRFNRVLEVIAFEVLKLASIY